MTSFYRKINSFYNISSVQLVPHRYKDACFLHNCPECLFRRIYLYSILRRFIISKHCSSLHITAAYAAMYFFHLFIQNAKHITMYNIITVHKCDQFSSGILKPLISGIRQAAVLLWITRNLRSFLHHNSHSRPLESVEPSSTELHPDSHMSVQICFPDILRDIFQHYTQEL